jgi:hypothetical protein
MSSLDVALRLLPIGESSASVLTPSYWIAQHSSKLLLALASTVFLGSDPTGSHDQICSFQDHLYVWKWDLPFDKRRGWSFWVSAISVPAQFCESAPALTQGPSNALILYGHHKHFVNAGLRSRLRLNLCIHSEPAVRYLNSRRIDRRQVTPIILRMHGYSLSTYPYIWISMILNDFCFLHNLVM